MKKYEELSRRYEEIIYGEYEKICERYEEIREKQEKIFRAFQQKAGGGKKSYADAYVDADTIPGMAPSTEREGGSPANWKTALHMTKFLR